MSVLFDRCVAKGGKVRTEALKGNKYRRICYLKDEVFEGEIKTKKVGAKRKRK